jgi:hypothetical protein
MWSGAAFLSFNVWRSFINGQTINVKYHLLRQHSVMCVVFFLQKILFRTRVFFSGLYYGFCFKLMIWITINDGQSELRFCEFFLVNCNVAAGLGDVSEGNAKVSTKKWKRQKIKTRLTTGFFFLNARYLMLW